MGNGRVLIVEDDPASRDILVQLVAHHEYDSDAVVSAEDALDLLGQTSYTLVLIDLALPQMDGWGLLRAMRANPNWQGSAVAVTAYYDSLVAHQAKEAGFLACFPKPVNSDVIENLLGLLPR
jgi:CheY-like chemotaxis protein